MHLNPTRRDPSAVHAEIMPDRVKDCIGFLELLVNTYKLAARSSRTLLLEATRDQLLCITEVILNTLEGNLRISNSPHLELSRFKGVLRKVPRIVVPKVASLKSRNSGSGPNSSFRTTVASRKQLRELYARHYKTLIEFLELCIPPLKGLLEREENGNGNDNDNEI